MIAAAYTLSLSLIFGWFLACAVNGGMTAAAAAWL